MKILFFSILLFLSTFSVSAQETVNVSSIIPRGKIAVWIYAADSAVNDSQKRQNYPILLDGTEIATTHPGRSFIAAISPGKHSFQVGKSKRLRIEKEFKAGQIYYLKVVEKNPKNQRSIGFELQPSEEGRKEIHLLKSVDDSDIKNKEIVINKSEG